MISECILYYSNYMPGNDQRGQCKAPNNVIVWLVVQIELLIITYNKVVLVLNSYDFEIFRPWYRPLLI
jgi:hypothetical protein